MQDIYDVVGFHPLKGIVIMSISQHHGRIMPRTSQPLVFIHVVAAVAVDETILYNLNIGT
jgi:hypothetical protein